MKQYCLYIFLFLMLLGRAQEIPSPAEKYALARKEAFEHKNFAKAIDLMAQVVEQTPNNVDYNIFLGRLYTWDKQSEKARPLLQATFNNNKAYEDAALAYANLEFWTGYPEKALEIADIGLQHHQDSEQLLVLKAKILMDLKRDNEAASILNIAMEYHPKSSVIRSLLQNISMGSKPNQVGVSYDLVYFKERFDQLWHVAKVHYGRQTGIGPIFAYFNYGNRFGNGATQMEIEFYPRISNVFYAYLGGAISNDNGVFPEYRGGFSLYANLPATFEVDAGFRLLKFNDETWVYTFGLGKYYKNYWFNVKTYLNTLENGVADSYAFTTRYYFGGQDDYLSVRIGTGFSPDNTSNNILLNNGTRLRSTNFSIGFRKLIGKTNIVHSELAYERIEFATDTFDDQYAIKVGYIKRF